MDRTRTVMQSDKIYVSRRLQMDLIELNMSLTGFEATKNGLVREASKLMERDETADK